MTLQATTTRSTQLLLSLAAVAALTLATAGPARAGDHQASETRPPASSAPTVTAVPGHDGGNATATQPSGSRTPVAGTSSPADRGRMRHGGYYYGGHHYGGYYPGYYNYPRYGWGWGFGWGNYPYYWGGAYGLGPYPIYVDGRPTRHDLGALDLDVEPEKAEVYLNGQPIGVCDDFDGYPGYLWLPAGTYDIAFYHPGFKTLARQYTIYPGLVIDVTDHLERGEAVLPKDLVSKSTARRDARIKEDEEKAAAAAGANQPPEAPPAMVQQGSARVDLSIAPHDASVYLDGRFLGTGDDLANLHAGLIVAPGEHHLEVVRPGYEIGRRSFAVASGQEVTIEVSLKRSDGGD